MLVGVAGAFAGCSSAYIAWSRALAERSDGTNHPEVIMSLLLFVGLVLLILSIGGRRSGRRRFGHDVADAVRERPQRVMMLPASPGRARW